MSDDAMNTTTRQADAPARPVIGLTGTIGAGKSTVAAILRELGCVVSDSDALARAALDDPAVRGQLTDRWGERVRDDRGALRRDVIAGIVFAEPAERRWLESVVHPWIGRVRDAAFAAAPATTPALVIDAPLLLEAGLERECDQVWMVDAPLSVRLQRVRDSRGWDESELRRREQAQWPAERKRALSHVQLDNAGSLDLLREGVRGVLHQLLANRRA